MNRTVKGMVLVGASAWLSYWVLLRPPAEGTTPTPRPAPSHRREGLILAPATAARVPAPAPSRPVPPPPERGTPEGKPAERRPEAPTAAAAPRAEKGHQKKPPAAADRPRAEVLREELERLAAAPELLAQAREELRGKTRRGFETVLLCAAEDQLAIARFFGETVLLVPKAAFGGENPRYYRLELGPPARPVMHSGRPPLAQFRQYRDLFVFPYDRLPAPLRALRRQVFLRSEVALFAALIPLREWALVVARRQAALAEYARRHGRRRGLDEVRRFVLRYVRVGREAFDIRVEEIHFADGSRWRPGTAARKGAGS